MDVNYFGNFQADVWGTVSDWIMILVTIITAGFLYFTLRSQQISLKLQQDLISIEKFNHRVKIMPKFSLKIKIEQYSLNGDIMTLSFSFRLINNNNLAINAIFTITDEEKIIQNIDRNPYKHNKVQPNDVFLFSNTLVKKVGISQGEPVFWIQMDMKVEFSDIEGNKYIQKFSNMIGNSDDDSMVIPFEPEMIS